MNKIIKSKNFRIILIVGACILLAVLLVVSITGSPSSTKSNDLAAQTEDELKNISDDNGTEDNAISHADILDEESAIEDSGERIFYVSKDEVYSFSMTDSNGILLEFEKSGDDWIYTDDTSIDINEDRIDNILNYITDVKFIDSFECDNPEDYGLTWESPLYVISDANDYSTFISLGKVEESNGNIYFALNYDFSTVYVNSGKLKNIEEYSIEELVAL